MEKLLAIQTELKAPKGQFNSFGKYKYRSCEDILEALKPLLSKADYTLTLTDEIVEVGGRVYIKATATIRDGLKTASVTAFARESLSKKGMDESQITGTASSYARKYALNGMFLIDDTQDADTQDNSDALISSQQILHITDLLKQSGLDEERFFTYMQVKSLKAITTENYPRGVVALENKIKEGA